MAAAAQLQLDRLHLGLAPPGAKLAFKVTPANGFVVRAMLDRDMHVVATWESTELDGGQVVQEVLVPTGTYTLQVSIAFFGPIAAEVEMEFGLAHGDVTQRATSKLSGQRPDLGRVLAVAVVR